MDFTCPHCDNGSFKIARKRVGGVLYATCLKCNKETVFSLAEMTISPKKKGKRSPRESRRLH
jgi:hypothetical protein